MRFISESNELTDISLTGGKGNYLQKLMAWGAPVPDFFIITTDTFKYCQKHSALPSKVEERFSFFFQSHKEIALRSSMIFEDTFDASFAGMFETLLNVNINNWRESLHHIFASVHSARVTEYLRKKRMEVRLEMAVVAQELVTVEKSGVIFTRSPVIPTSAIAIDAAFGMGEGVVSGLADVDHYQLTRTLDVISIKKTSETPVLDFEEMKTLSQLALKLENKLGVPADLEWGIKDKKLYLFQIRPITRSFFSLTYFVDTNLSESYPGTVSPFTAAFVQKAYENVFYESAVLLGAREPRLSQLNFHYKKLICCVDNHLYYNLEHYYAVLRALPGGEKNIRNWHKMIGGKIDDHVIPFHKTHLSKIENVSALLSLLRIAVNRRKIFRPFLARLESAGKDIEGELMNLRQSRETISYLNDLIHRPLGFGLTVVNDVFIMIGLGYLTSRLKKKGYTEEDVIDMLKTETDVDSLKPLEHFNRVVSSLQKDFLDEFLKAPLGAGTNPYEEFFNKMEASGRHDQASLLKDFIEDFGDRSFEELKLESLPLKNNPALLKDLIKWAGNNSPVHPEPLKKKAGISLGWADEKALFFTRDCIAMREAARLWRGKYYHLLRRLIMQFSDQLKKEDEWWRQFSLLDFFSISHDVWLAFSENRLSKEEIGQMIKQNAAWQTKKKNYPEIIPWIEGEPLPDLNPSIDSGSIKGQGVSQGTAEGFALVLEHPGEALQSELSDFILVTKNTDPAWVYIMARSKGLISEKGSLLSHTAIIGRELNIPTIVGVKHATLRIKNGDRIRIDAFKGTIEVI